MTVIGLLGDRTTTTAMALAESWPGSLPVALIEADPTGGSLLGWLDDASAPGRRRGRGGAELTSGAGTPIDVFLRDLERNGGAGSDRTLPDRVIPNGFKRVNNEGNTGEGPIADLDLDLILNLNLDLEIVTAPVHPLEAERAVARLPIASPLTLETSHWREWCAERTCVIDLGCRPHRPLAGLNLSALDLLVVVVAQRSASEGAAAAHIGRMTGVADQLRASAGAQPPVAVLVVGDRPFDPFEVGDHIRSRLGVVSHERVGDEAANEPSSGVFVLPSDPLAAAVLAGRAGMSARRWSKTRLGRAAAFAARELAELTNGVLGDPVLNHHAEAVGG